MEQHNLTDDPRVETLEEGGGVKLPSKMEAIDYFFALLTEAQDYVKELQRFAGRSNFEMTKLVDRLNDWIDMQEENDGLSAQATLRFDSSPQTNASAEEEEERAHALASRSPPAHPLSPASQGQKGGKKVKHVSKKA